MDSAASTNAGKHAQRGFHFQTSGFLFYLLLRWFQFSDLEASIEPPEGEDAKMVYTINEGGRSRRVTELIQYKKRESPESDAATVEDYDEDDWQEGPIQPSLLKKWVKTKRADKSVLDLLETDENTYYTAIVFGDLSPTVAKFAVPNLPGTYTFKEYASRFSEAFPVNYTHASDPQPDSQNLKKNLRFGSENTRRRIRVLRFGSPQLIEAQSRLLLELHYGNKKAFSALTFEQLYWEIRRRELSLSEKGQQIDLSALQTIIDEGKVSHAHWQNAAETLQHDESRTESNRWKHTLSSVDFENGRYVHLPLFDSAWDALEQTGFLVICGEAGSGKTTLALYLTHRFLQTNQNATAYYLRLTPDTTLDEEKEFLTGHIDSNALFVLDDQHLAVDEAEPLIRTYVDYFQANVAHAKLIVTSSITYGLGDKTAFGTKPSELRRATSIRLPTAGMETMPGIVAELRTKTDLNSELSDNELAELSGGNIGLAIIVARCSQYWTEHDSIAKSKLQDALIQWIFDELARPVDKDFYLSEIVPVFIIGSREVPIPEDFRTSLVDLQKAGFLTSEETQNTRMYSPTNHVFAILVSSQHADSSVAAWTDFLRKYKQQMPTTCERLAANQYGRSILKTVCEEDLELFLHELKQVRKPLGLDSVNRVLFAIDLASRRSDSTRLLSELLSSNGEFNSNFFLRFLHPERLKDAKTATLTSFFNTLRTIDRDSVLVRRVTQAELLKNGDEGQITSSRAGEIVISILLGFFDNTATTLDDVGECLRAVFRCSAEFAKLLYDQWKASPSFAAKVADTETSERSVLIWLRYCQSIKQLNRQDCYAYFQEYIQDQQLNDIINRAPEFNRFASLLTTMRRLNPQKASQILTTVYTDHRNELLDLLRGDKSISVLAHDLHTIALVNKRIGVNVTSMLQPHITSRIAEMGTYNQLGSFIQHLRAVKNLSFLSGTLANVDYESILNSFKRERRQFNLVGRTLIALAENWPELALKLSDDLTYRIVTSKITQPAVLNYVPIIRGVVAVESLKPDGLERLLDELIRDRSLVPNLHRAWTSAKNMTERSFCLSQLLECTNSRSQIVELLGFANLNSFERDVRECFRNEEIPINIANGLFATAKFDLFMAYEALSEYVQRFASQSTGSSSTPRHLPPRPRSYLPRGRRVTDFVDMGCLLRAAAAIDVSLARKLTDHLHVKDFAANVNEQMNPGRLAVFILGLHEASRKESRTFVELISDQKLWAKQFETTEILDNSIHFARAVGHVSLKRGSEYVRFLLDNYYAQISTQLEVEASLILVANWLRVLPMAGKAATQQHLSQMYSLLLSTTEYDTRLRPLLETTEGLIECDWLDLAAQFAEKALEHADQIKSVHGLHDWLIYLHKSLRIARTLKQPDFVRTLFAASPSWAFFARTFSPSPTVLRAYTYHLLQFIDSDGFDELRQGVSIRRGLIIEAALSERRVIVRALSLILARASLEQIQNTARDCQWLQPWEIGLLALMFASIFPEHENPFLAAPILISEDVLRASLTEHSHNLEFGLTLCLAAMSGVGPTVKEYEAERDDRASDERNSAIRWLLQWGPEKPDLAELPYYVWSILKSTVLRPTYIAWESDISNRVIGGTVLQHYTPDYAALASD